MKKIVTIAFFALIAALSINAQTHRNPLLKSIYSKKAEANQDTIPKISVSDSLLQVYDGHFDDLFAQPVTLPEIFFMPAVYDRYDFFSPLQLTDTVYSGNPAMRWIEDYDLVSRQMKTLQHDLFYNHPEHVRYNLSMLPEAPKQYQAKINLSDFTISTIEIDRPDPTINISAEAVEKRHWIRTFTASLQFSQAYVSPNWYQGGNNNLNALAHIYYNVKLNQEYHPDLLFETTAQYKLGINNAPEDSIHSYNVTEDVLQINTTFGVKAAHRWYYSFTGQFKTQVINSYKTNSHSLKSAFLSPGELTAGVGMTYNYANPSKSFTFDTSLAPLSYKLSVCTNSQIDPTLYSIDEGKTTKSSFGSTAEIKLAWKMTYNITLTSRIFAFSDYNSFQADWENTLACSINKYFTTQIYAHLRYDTKTPYDADTNWRKLQLKEIFSIGFAYKFSSL